MRHLVLLVLASAASLRALDVPAASSKPSGARIDPEPPLVRRPNPLISGLQRVTATPVKLFREAPPITRSWVTASIVMAWLSSQRLIDMRNICVDERAVWYRGEWWRLLTNFFFMGDSFLSVFFWMQMYNFWECLKARRRSSSSRRRRRVHTAPTRRVHRAPRPCRHAWWPAAERHTGRCSLDRPPIPGRCSSWSSTGTSLRTSSR